MRRRRTTRSTRAPPPCTPEDPATILYTSGTTGDPKGVELTHRNVLFDCEAGLRISGLEGTNLTVSYLPYAHIAERILSLYIPQHYGDGHIYLVADPSLLLGALGEVHPAQFFGVPRVWEKIQSGLSGLLAMEPDAAKKAAIQSAMGSARSTSSRSRSGTPLHRSSRPATTRSRAPCSVRSRRCSASTR